MNGTLRTAKMPNPSIAIAARSYAGNKNIGGTFCFIRLALVAAAPPQVMRYNARRYANASDQRRG